MSSFPYRNGIDKLHLLNMEVHILKNLILLTCYLAKPSIINALLVILHHKIKNTGQPITHYLCVNLLALEVGQGHIQAYLLPQLCSLQGISLSEHRMCKSQE